MTPYLVLGVAGLVLLAVALVVGDLLDGVLDGLGGDWFSTEVVGAFVSAVGFAGAIADAAGAPTPVTLAVGGAAGVGFASFAAWLTRLVKGGGEEEAPTAGDTVGFDAMVVSAIPEGGFGVVTVRRGEHVTRYNARADLPLEAGTRVHVTGVLSPTAVTVAPLWDTLGP